ncbi:MAG: hypothetical protein ACYDDO_02635 [Acidiferrobacterales bacterium]
MDPDANIVEERYAVVYAPRRQRGRFPEECVQVVKSEALARAGADAKSQRYAARVVGPARSSEGFRLFYLVSWLED